MSAIIPCDPNDARFELFKVITAYPAEAPSWPDFGLEREEFWNALVAIEPFDIAEGVRAFYRLYAAAQGKARYGDKTNGYCRHIPGIESLLPEARFIHLIRDGRDSALSMRRQWVAPGRDMETLASYWRLFVREAREAGLRARSYLEVRYEDLVLRQQGTLEKICAFVELSFDGGMLRYWERTAERLQEHRTRYFNDGRVQVSHEQRVRQQRLTMQPPQPGRIGCWRNEMTRPEQSEFRRFAGDTLEELGYRW